MADSKPQKIFSVSGKDWMSGISGQNYMPLGGLFKDAPYFDPFERPGIYVQAQQTSQIVAGTTFVVDPRYMVGYADQTTGKSMFYTLGWGEAFHITVDSPGVYVASSVATGIKSISRVYGAIRYKDKLLYANDTTVTSNTIPVSATSETNILAGLTQNDGEHPFHIGPDRNCYMAAKNHVARITNVDNQIGNTKDFLTFEDDVFVRDLTDDGRHLVIIGDTGFVNAGVTTSLNTKNRCFVAFWNMKSIDLTQIWEIQDSRLYSVEIIEDKIVVYGEKANYECSVNTQPSPVLPLTRSATIAGASVYPAAVIRKENGIALFSTREGNIFGFGRPYPYVDKVLYHYASRPAATGTGIYCLYDDGNELFGSVKGGKALYTFAGGDNRTISSIVFSDLDFGGTFELSFIKVVLRRPLLDSGAYVTVELSSQGDNRTIMKSSSATRSSKGDYSSWIFYPSQTTSATANRPVVESGISLKLTNSNAEISRLEIWGKTVDPTIVTY